MNPHSSPVAIIAAILCLAGITGLYGWTSRINQFFFFSRTLPREFQSTPAATAIRRRYVAAVVSGFVLAAGAMMALYAVAHWTLLMAMITALLLQTLVCHIAYGWAHHAAGIAFAEALSAGTMQQPEVGTPAPGHTISVPLLRAAPGRTLVGMLLPAATAVMLWMVATLLSGMGISGFADRAAAEGGAVLLGMATGMLVSGTGSLLLLRYSARHRTPMAQYIGRIMQWTMGFSVLIVAGLALAALRSWTVTRGAAHMVMLAILIMVMLHVVYAWTRVKTFAPPSAEQNGDEYWRWGLFYYNPGDPALVVQRRMGPGYTLNFGNTYSWPIFAFAVADLAFVLFSRHHL